MSVYNFDSFFLFLSGNFGDPRPPEVATDTHPDLDAVLLDVLISNLNNGAELDVQETTPLCSDDSATSSEAPSPLSVSITTLECTNETNIVDPLDIPFLTEQCDLTTFLDSVSVISEPTFSNTCSSGASPMFCNTTVENTLETTTYKDNVDLSECMHLFPDSLEQSVIDLSDSELNQLFNTLPSQEPLNCESEPTTPVSPVVSSEPHTPQVSNSRKRRKVSEIEPKDIFPPKKSKVEKHVERRIKNNAASRVSRAKRRERHTTVFSRVEELEEQNAKLRIQAQEMEAETARLKKLLVERLSK